MDRDTGNRNLRVVLTRQSSDNLRLREKLEAKGISVKEVPTLAITYIKPLSTELEELKDFLFYGAMLFSSRNGVDGFFKWYKSQTDFDVKRLAKLIGAVGPGTALQLEKYGLVASVVANPATGSELAARVIKKISPGSNVLAIRGTTSKDQASKILEEKNYRISKLTVYENIEPSIERISSDYQAILFASPLAVERYFKINELADNTKVVAIGSTTGNYLEQLKIKHKVSISTDTNSLAETLFNELEFVE